MRRASVVDGDWLAIGSFQIDENLSWLVRGVWGIDPYHSILGLCVGRSLFDIAVAPELIDFVFTLTPTTTPVGCDGNWLVGIFRRCAKIASVSLRNESQSDEKNVSAPTDKPPRANGGKATR